MNDWRIDVSYFCTHEFSVASNIKLLYSGFANALITRYLFCVANRNNVLAECCSLPKGKNVRDIIVANLVCWGSILFQSYYYKVN